MSAVSPATQADVAQLCSLLSILFSGEAEFAPDEDKQSRALRAIIGHPETGCILVWREGEQIRGMVSLLNSISTACGGKVAILEDMIVHPSRQGEGIGTKLLAEAIEWAQQQGCLRITLLTDNDNEQAIRFYRRQGFAKSAMIPLRLALAAAAS